MDETVQAREDEFHVSHVQPGQQAAMRGGEQQATAGFEDADKFGKRRSFIRYVLDHLHDGDGVEVLVGVRGATVDPDGLKMDFGEPLFHLTEHARIYIDSVRL
jgi:hypothetical protein